MMKSEMLREQLMERIDKIDAVDTHTHLVGDRLCAADFWQIAHYFWLFKELQAGGYPAHAAELPEKQRIEAFLSAHRASKHTMMNKALTRIFRDLYDIELKDETSIIEANEAVKASSSRTGWAQQVTDQAGIREFVVNIPEHAAFEGMRKNAIVIPRIDGKLSEWVKSIGASSSPIRTYEQVCETIESLFLDYKGHGYPGIMTTLPRLNAPTIRQYDINCGATQDEIMSTLLQTICAGAERHGLMVQFFLGVERSWCREPVPANDTERILMLNGLFDRYHCPFELVVASEMNNMDVVQAAWNFPHVHAGGLWWFNFRTSTYRQCMQYRLEALPTLNSSLVASDSRCIEWTYGKLWLVKQALVDFLTERIISGWIDEEEALHIAQNWLYESAARRYKVGDDQ